MLVLECTGGRYPASRVAHVPAAIAATLAVRDGLLILRIDDADHPDRWEEFRAPLAGLFARLCLEGKLAGN